MRSLHLGLMLLLTAACQPVGQSGINPAPVVTGLAPAAPNTITVTETIVVVAPPPKPKAPETISDPVPVPAMEPTSTVTTATASTPSPQPIPVPPTLAPVVLPVFDPTDVMQQPPTVLERKLGPPSVVRQEGQVQIWQYRLANCVADFFFYPAGDNDGSRLTTWDARSAVIGQTFDARACRTSLTAHLRQMMSN